MNRADKVCSNDDRGLTLTCLTAKSTFLSNAFYGEMLKLEFIETVEVYELKAGTNSCLSKTRIHTVKREIFASSNFRGISRSVSIFENSNPRNIFLFLKN